MSNQYFFNQYFNKAGVELDLVKNIQWVGLREDMPKTVNVVAIEKGLADLFESFYPDFNDKEVTVLVLYNGQNEGDWRVSAIVAVSKGDYSFESAEYIHADFRITKPGNKVEYASISIDGKLLQSFTRYDEEWEVL